MRRAEAARLAGEHMMWGHHYGPPLAWVYCPRCRTRVEVEHGIHDPMVRERNLRMALSAHLVDECPGQATCVRRGR